MEVKKSTKAQLGRKRGQFLNIGVIVALAVTISAFEWRSYDACGLIDASIIIEDVPIDFVPPTVHEEPKPPKPKVAPIFVEQKNDDLEVELEEFLIDIDDLKNFDPEGYQATMTEEVAPEFVTIAEVMPEFEGGQIGFLNYIAKKINYPTQARRMGIEGRVFVEFIIDVDGAIIDVKAVKGIGAGCDEEAVRVIKSAPNWKPGKQRGVPIKVKMIVPINFTLQ